MWQKEAIAIVDWFFHFSFFISFFSFVVCICFHSFIRIAQRHTPYGRSSEVAGMLLFCMPLLLPFIGVVATAVSVFFFFFFFAYEFTMLVYTDQRSISFSFCWNTRVALFAQSDARTLAHLCMASCASSCMVILSAVTLSLRKMHAKRISIRRQTSLFQKYTIRMRSETSVSTVDECNNATILWRKLTQNGMVSGHCADGNIWMVFCVMIKITTLR